MATGSAVRRETPRLGPQHLFLRRPQQADSAAPRSLPGVFCSPPVGTVRKNNSMARTTLNGPDPSMTIRSSPPLLWARASSTTKLRGGSGDPTVHRRPAPPGVGGSARAPCVRDRARQGRNGAAGSSEADEPGPKGDAKL